MGNFNKGDRFGGKKSFGGDRGGFNKDRFDRPTMHHATCASCGKDCEVPFRPNGTKPVFCSDCFGKQDGYENKRNDRRDARPSFGEKPMFKATCDSCGTKCEVPFKPTGDKPVYCRDCFGGKNEKGGGSNATRGDQYQKQFDMLNAKLDDILSMLLAKPVKPAKKEEIKPTVKKEKVTKAKAVKKVVKKKK